MIAENRTRSIPSTLFHQSPNDFPPWLGGAMETNRDTVQKTIFPHLKHFRGNGGVVQTANVFCQLKGFFHLFCSASRSRGQ